MPNVKTHDQIALLSLLPTFYVGTLIFKDIGLTSVLTLSTIVSAFIFSPDLDTNSIPYRRWGVLRCIWLPYTRFISHRSSWSHSYILAPIFKTIYIASICVIIWFLYSLISNNFDISETLIQQKSLLLCLKENYLSYIIAIVVGLFWANAQHVATDRLCSSYKKIAVKL